MSFGIGEIKFDDIIGKMLGHGISQGAVTAAQGGKFQHGFFSAAFTAGLAPGIMKTARSDFGKVLASSVVGGTASVLGGGKCANGAITGAYVMLFNHMQHPDDKKNPATEIADAAGIGAGVEEYSNVSNGKWKGKNGKWYDTDWGGNQHTGNRNRVVGRAGLFRTIGRTMFWGNAFVSGLEGGTALYKGDYAGTINSAIGIGVGAVATFGGPIGLAVGAAYLLNGIMTTPIISTTYTTPFGVRDNTYIVPPIIPIR